MTYPYSFLSPENMNVTDFPPIDFYHDELSGCQAQQSDYDNARDMWNFCMDNRIISNFGDLTRLYNKLDVTLLSDVFEDYRKVVLDFINLDPAKFISQPSLAMTALLKHTGKSFERYTDDDKDVYKKNRENIQGGLCFMSRAASDANNEYMSNYDKEKDATSIMCLDCISMYPYVLTLPLPETRFRSVIDNSSIYEKFLNTELDETKHQVLTELVNDHR